MHRDRQAVTGGGLVDRPVLAAAERVLGAVGQDDLDPPAVPRAALDLGDGEVGVLVGDDEGANQTRLLVHPLDHPVVDRARDLGGELGHLVAAEQAKAVEDAVVDPELIEQLRAQEAQVAAGEAVGPLRPGVQAEAGVGRSRVELGDDRRAAAEALQVASPAPRHTLEELVVGERRMDVAVDERHRSRGIGHSLRCCLHHGHLLRLLTVRPRGPRSARSR